MKKTVFGLFVAIIIGLVSCNKKESIDCMSRNYQFHNIKFPDKTLLLRVFKDTAQQLNFIDGRCSNSPMFSALNYKQMVNDSFISMTIYTNKLILSNDSLSNINLLGVLFYVKEKDYMKTKLFKYNGLTFDEIPAYHLKTNFISTNDIYEIGELQFKNMRSVIYLDGNQRFKISHHNQKDELQSYIYTKIAPNLLVANHLY